MAELDFSKSAPDVTEEVVRESELYLQGQLTLATSADQRASVLAGVFAAAGAAVAAGVIALLTSNLTAANGDTDWSAVAWGGGISAGLFLIGSALCIWATMPVGFNLPGSQPVSWQSDVKDAVPLDDSLKEQVVHYQGKIDDNRKVLESNAGKFKWGAIFGISAPVAGALIWAAISFCQTPVS